MKPNGFTLLEILVALAVFGLLLVGLSRTVGFGLTAWRQDARVSGRTTDLEAVDRALRSVVENLAPGEEAGSPPIDGAGTSVTGLTQLRLPGPDLAPVPVEAGLAVSGSRLVLRWRPYRHAMALGPQPRPDEPVLIGGVAGLAIAYWRAPGMWVSQWHDPNLPLLIRFQVTFAGPSATRWPDIVVAPLLSRP